MKLKQSEKALILVALILFVLVIFNRVYLLPQKAQVKLLKDILSSKEELYKEYLFLVKNRDFFEKNTEKLEKEYKKILDKTWDYISYQEVASSLLEIVDGIGKKAKLQILKKDILDKKAHPYFDEVRVSLEIQAPLPNILYFLYLVRTQKRLIMIKKFSLYLPNEGTPTANIELSVFRQISK